MKPRLKVIDHILEAVARSQNICVCGHVRPDGDCIGSQLGLTLALQKQGKDVACWNEDVVPQKYAFLDRHHFLQKPSGHREFDLVIATDCASFERLGVTGPAIVQRKCLINIDHHLSNTRYGDLNWISAREASTGELIFRLLQAAQWPITPAIADCLYTAVSTDTGSFQYATTKPVTYHTAAELVRLGADVDMVSREVYQSFSLSRVRLLKHLYSHFHLTDDNKIAYLWLKKKDFARTGADRSDTEGLIDHIRAIEPVCVAAIFEEVEPELVRVSLRSKSPDVDVNKVAGQFGGGGHVAAAGARIVGKPLSVQRKVLAAVRREIHRASK
jgi:phosphoesterase RecJ-like protein